MGFLGETGILNAIWNSSLGTKLKWSHEAKGTKGISQKLWQHKNIDNIFTREDGVIT